MRSAQVMAASRSSRRRAIRNADAAQVFQQRQLQHDREGPQFAQLQRLDGLVGGDELGGVVAVDTTVHVGDQLQRQVIDAGETG